MSNPSPIPHDPRPGDPAPLVPDLNVVADHIALYATERRNVLARWTITGDRELLERACRYAAILEEWKLA